jgi:hypothetical protein
MYHAFWLGISTALDAVGGGLGELTLRRLRALDREVDAAAGPRERDRDAAEPDPRLDGAVAMVGAVWENGESAVVGDARLGVSALSVGGPRRKA